MHKCAALIFPPWLLSCLWLADILPASINPPSPPPPSSLVSYQQVYGHYGGGEQGDGPEGPAVTSMPQTNGTPFFDRRYRGRVDGGKEDEREASPKGSDERGNGPEKSSSGDDNNASGRVELPLFAFLLSMVG